MPSENKMKIYIVLVIIFFGGVLEILPEQVTTIVPAILFILVAREGFEPPVQLHLSLAAKQVCTL